MSAREGVYLRLVRLIGVIVPRRLRADWKQEWLAELLYREELLSEWHKLNLISKLDLTRHSLGAFWDAIWLQSYRLEDEMFQDLRYGTRLLLKQPAFSSMVILVLALGIGPTTAMFSVVNSVLLRPLPYTHPERLMVYTAVQEGGAPPISAVTAPDFEEWRSECSAAEIAAYTGAQPGNFTAGTEPDRVRIARVSENLFSTMGVQPEFGRTFLKEEIDRPLTGGDIEQAPIKVAILGHALWQRNFGGDSSIVGKTVKVEGDLCSVIGVMPNAFRFPDDADVWLPVTLSQSRNNAYLRVIARLQPGVTSSQAQTELTTLAQRLQQEAPQKNRILNVTLTPLQEQIVGNVRPSMLIFFGAVTFVLLIACANVANLLLARATTRQKEIAVRSALGASRLRIFRQLLTESILLALAGGCVGLAMAALILKALIGFVPPGIPRLSTIGVDPWVLGFTLFLSVTTGILFGLAPALQATRIDLNAALKEGSFRIAGSRRRMRSLLVIAEVSMALVLLIGAGLLLKSFARLRETNLGFNPDNVLTATVTLPQASYPTTAQVKEYAEQALARLKARGEVQSAAVVTWLPLAHAGATIQGSFTVDKEVEERPGAWASKVASGGDYFDALAIPIKKGRVFDERDAAGSPRVVVISERLANRLWPNEDAVGKRINVGLPGETLREVVGVVGDVRQNELGGPLSPTIYEPYAQIPDKLRWFVSEMTFVIRTNDEPQNFIATLRNELQQIDGEQPLHNIAVMKQVVARSVTDPRFYTLVLGSFSALAFILAVAGIYSVISYSVTQRTHEIGIRLALGAQRRSVLTLVVRQGMTVVLAGLVIGLAGARALTRVLSGFLYQVSVTDAATFVVLSCLLAAVAFLACYFPARRATKVDPLTALRHE